MKTGPFLHGRYRPIQQGDLVYSEELEAGPLYTQQLKTTNNYDNPSSVDLINALKVSGRTKTDWGSSTVTKRHLLQLKKRHKKQGEEVEPLSNYNVLVLDQRFRKKLSCFPYQH
jgi:hypothetical protein